MILSTTKKGRLLYDVQPTPVVPPVSTKIETVEERHIRTDTVGERRRARQTKIENELI